MAQGKGIAVSDRGRIKQETVDRYHAEAGRWAARSSDLADRLTNSPEPTPSGLLIRGFGVRVPGGAPVIMALTCGFSPGRGHFRVHCGRLGARGVLWSRWTVPALCGLDGLFGIEMATCDDTGAQRCGPHRRHPGRTPRTPWVTPAVRSRSI